MMNDWEGVCVHVCVCEKKGRRHTTDIHNTFFCLHNWGWAKKLSRACSSHSLALSTHLLLRFHQVTPISLSLNFLPLSHNLRQTPQSPLFFPFPCFIDGVFFWYQVLLSRAPKAPSPPFSPPPPTPVPGGGSLSPMTRHERVDRRRVLCVGSWLMGILQNEPSPDSSQRK